MFGDYQEESKQSALLSLPDGMAEVRGSDTEVIHTSGSTVAENIPQLTCVDKAESWRRSR